MSMTDEDRQQVRQEAKQLAADQGLNWKELPEERRKEFRRMAKQSARQTSQDQSGD